MTRLRTTRPQRTTLAANGKNRAHLPLPSIGVVVLAVTLSIAGCGSSGIPSQANPSTYATPSQADPSTSRTPSQADPSTSPTPSHADPSTTSPSVPTHTVASDKDAVVQADRAFWADYAKNDPRGACSRIFGYANGHIVAMTGQFLTDCISTMGAYSSKGTALTIGDPVVYDGTIALVSAFGRVCGAESPKGGNCATIPEMKEAMPASGNEADFDAALSAILTAWGGSEPGWAPDVLVKVDGRWHPLLPIADPVTPGPAPDSPSSGKSQPKKPWTTQDWSETCASGGCGAVPGLPPFHPGGGLSNNIG